MLGRTFMLVLKTSRAKGRARGKLQRIAQTANAMETHGV